VTKTKHSEEVIKVEFLLAQFQYFFLFYKINNFYFIHLLILIFLLNIFINEWIEKQEKECHVKQKSVYK
jgi:hypothetical protein